MDPNMSNVPMSPQGMPTAPNYGEQKPSVRSHILEFFQTLVIFAAIGIAIYYFLAQPHKVSGSSMYPTFKNDDYIITNKIGYRFHQPQRGDVIVFKNPRDLSQDFIKRIIGLPGEKVKVQDGHVFINDKQLPEPYLDPSVITDPRTYMTEGVDVTVAPGTYIVMGDNRLGSSDSREWGPITKDEIIGQAFFRYWPQNVIGVVQGVHYPTN